MEETKRLVGLPCVLVRLQIDGYKWQSQYEVDRAESEERSKVGTMELSSGEVATGQV